MKIDNFKIVFRILIVLFFASPYFYQLYFLLSHQDLAAPTSIWSEVQWAFTNSFIQALASTLGALSFASFFVQAYFKLRKRGTQNFFISLLLLPSLIPTLFILLSLMPVFDLVGRGLKAISLAHAFIFSGFATLQIIIAIQNKCGDYIESCYVAGVSKAYFFKSVVVPLIKKDLFYISLIIFISSFSSFSVPLVLGDIRHTTLEVLIYEKFKINYDFYTAFTISSLQSMFLVMASLFTIRKPFTLNKELQQTQYLSSNLSFCIFVLVYLVFLINYFLQFSYILKFPQLALEAVKGAMPTFAYTLKISLVTSLVGFIFIQVYSFFYNKKFIHRFFEVFIVPSSTLVGLSVLFMFNFLSSFQRLILALLTLFFPWVVKLIMHPKLLSLSAQEEVSYLAGASRWQVYRYVRLPQLKNETIWALSLISVWSISDFTVTRIILEKQESLALVLFSLMSGYRLNQSIILSVVLILMCLLSYFLISWSVNAIYKIIEKKI